MNINFVAALASLLATGEDWAFRLANGIRPPGEYILNLILPERLRNSYTISSSTMTLRPTMSGLVPMDSPYPPTGAVEMSKFIEQSAKFGAQTRLPEAVLRELQATVMRLAISGGDTNQAAVNAILNFVATMLVQPHLDTMEYLRGRALAYGEIDWTFNNVNLAVDYAIPVGNILTQRSGNDHYGGSASKFWVDVLAAKRLLKQRVRAVIAHPDTIDMIISNTVNALEVVDLNEATGSASVVRLVDINGVQTRSSDRRERLSLIAHGAEGEILDPATPGATKKIKFFPEGRLVFVGDPITRATFVEDRGSQEDPQDAIPLGYTHIAPTVEAGGRPGRYVNVYVPEGRPYQLHGESAMNGLPVIEAPDRLVIARTDMA